MSGSDKPFSFFRGKVHLYQSDKHRLSVDLVLFLSRSKGIRKSSRVIDLGAGFGFLSVVIAKKFGSKVVALEKDKSLFELLKRNVEVNHLTGYITPVLGDVREVHRLFKRGEFDVVITNPPFYPSRYGVEDGGTHFEKETTLKDFLSASSYLLRDGGYLNLLIPAFRLAESFRYMEEVNLPPRFLTVMYPTVHKEGKLCVVSSIRNVPGPIRIEKALFINKPEGGYTEEVERILEGFL